MLKEQRSYRSFINQLKNMRKIIVLSLIVLPFLAFAADSVSIESVSARANGVATASGESVYDVATQTNGSFDGGTAQNSTETDLAATKTGLHSGQHTFQATVGGASQTVSFIVPSGEGTVVQGKGAL